EVVHRAQVNVRRVVPGVGQGSGNRHPPLAGQIPAQPPVAEVGKGNDAFLAEPQHFAQDEVRVTHRLQGLGHDHGVEAATAEVGQALDVQILLDHVHALADTGGDFFAVDLQPIALHLFVLLQVVQQHAVATAQIQHARAGLNPLLNDLQVGAHG